MDQSLPFIFFYHTQRIKNGLLALSKKLKKVNFRITLYILIYTPKFQYCSTVLLVMSNIFLFVVT